MSMPNSSPILARLVTGDRPAGCASPAVLAVTDAACGMNQQTLRPTRRPRASTWMSVGDQRGQRAQSDDISAGAGRGFPVRTMVAADRTQLTAISGNAIKVRRQRRCAAQRQRAAIDQSGQRSPVVLTDGPLVTVKSPDLAAGLHGQRHTGFQLCRLCHGTGAGGRREPGPYSPSVPQATPSSAD